ncbi:MAG: hypothetical protein F6K35_19070 [Okeania sp. SIO2H7]|nr:hypothetical protein [Okeania sp. SIO2H7]
MTRVFTKQTLDWAKDELAKVEKKYFALLNILENSVSEVEKTNEQKSGLTTKDFLKKPKLGVKNSILELLRRHKQRQHSSDEIIKGILNIKQDNAEYNRIANNVRQALRAGAKNGDWQRKVNNNKITYSL